MCCHDSQSIAGIRFALRVELIWFSPVAAGISFPANPRGYCEVRAPFSSLREPNEVAEECEVVQDHSMGLDIGVSTSVGV